MKTLRLPIVLTFISIFLGCGSQKDTQNVIPDTNPSAFLLYEDAEDQTTAKWEVREGSSDTAMIRNVYDDERESRVIEFQGNGTNDAYVSGAERGETAWNLQKYTAISWHMKYDEDAVIYIMVDTTQGIRYLFYTASNVRGLLHGFERGIMHGLGGGIKDGRWRRITRDLESDLKDAEPDNDLLAINGVIIRGSGRIDDMIFYAPQKMVYENGNHGTGAWRVVDNDPDGADIVIDSDTQQGNYISLVGDGFSNAYRIGDIGGDDIWQNRSDAILQWRFKAFGPDVEVMDASGFIRDEEAFAFRIYVETEQGRRELTYTLGATSGLLEDGITIHHALGDDRIRGSILLNSGNALGLWQTVTRDLEEDIRDFEPNNRLRAINGLEVRGSGWMDDVQSLSSID